MYNQLHVHDYQMKKKSTHMLATINNATKTKQNQNKMLQMSNFIAFQDTLNVLQFETNKT
jgi:hypothetical protein